MPFIAIDNNSDERIDITEISDPKGSLKGRPFTCQLCGAQMSVKASEARLVAPHFFHFAECNSPYKSHPESQEHRLGKKYVASQTVNIFENHFSVKVEKEFPVPQVSRVLDVVFIYPFGWMWANEVQLSKTTIDDLSARTNDYLRAGIDVVWWLGRGADTPALREWCVERYGFTPYLSFNMPDEIECGYWVKSFYYGIYGERKSELVRRPYSKSAVNSENVGHRSLDDCLIEWWITTAFNRYFQVWNRCNPDLLTRGFIAKKKTVQSFFGKIGARNKLFRKYKGDWIINWDAYFQHETRWDTFSTLDAEAIALVKKRAFELSTS